jgi:hypothetical protein
VLLGRSKHKLFLLTHTSHTNKKNCFYFTHQVHLIPREQFFFFFNLTSGVTKPEEHNMRVGVYVHNEGDNETTKLMIKAVSEYLQSKGFNPQEHNCLCNDKQKSLERIVFLHPGNNNDCWTSTQETIQTHPHTEFHIFSEGNHHRRAAIGEHPNTCYITHPIQHITQLAQRYLQHTSTSTRITEES